MTTERKTALEPLEGVDHKEYERWKAKVQFAGDDECWPWTGGLQTGEGYGYLVVRRNGKYRKRAAHRLSYEYHVGPTHFDLRLQRTCSMKHCVNPRHVYLPLLLDEHGNPIWS